jgi:hypothetical protein
MNSCPSCGVYLSDAAKTCPLCGSRAVASDDHGDGRIPAAPSGIRRAFSLAESRPSADQGDRLTPTETRRMAVELISVSLGLILVISTGIDFLIAKGISWSRYTTLVLAMLWLASSIPLILRRHPFLIFAVLGPSLFLEVFLWSLFSGSLDWFIPLGIPILVACEGAVVGSGAIIAAQRRHGLNSVGVILAACVFVCIVTDAAVVYFLAGRFALTWSIVVCISAIPVAGLFFYLHYRVTNKASLRKLFRL